MGMPVKDFSESAIAVLLQNKVENEKVLKTAARAMYSLAYLVVPNTEEQFSQPFLGLSKIWQLFQDPIII